jgi:benzoyl-CoA reductase/2-hydroxyglutaryl-CoA dehydratase subunit BcrC/BadD/HgdB
MKKENEKKSALPLRTWPFLKQVNNSFNDGIKNAMDGGKPIIFASAMCPQQLGGAFDAVWLTGEWYGSICGFTKDVSLCEKSERNGFPHEMCSYARMALGTMYENRSFLGKYPKPVAVLGTEGLCNVQAKWFEAQARYQNVPFYVIDSAPAQASELMPGKLPERWKEDTFADSVEYYARQLGNALEFFEWATGQKANEEKLIDAVITQQRNEELWDELLALWSAKPSPIAGRSLFTFENLIISLPTRHESTQVLKAIIDELRERIEKGIHGIGNEEIRLLWQAQPGWYILDVIRYFESQGANFVVSPYLGEWGAKYKHRWCEGTEPEWFKNFKEPKNFDDCLREVAKSIIAQMIRPRVGGEIKAIKEIAVEAQIDGAVFHAVRGCKGVSYAELAEREILRNDLELPGFLLEGSPADPRDFSEGPAMRQIRTFVEQVKRMKKRRELKNQ